MDAELRYAVLLVAESLPHWPLYKEAQIITELHEERFEAVKRKIQPWHDDVDKDLRDVRNDWRIGRDKMRKCASCLGEEVLKLIIEANEKEATPCQEEVSNA